MPQRLRAWHGSGLGFSPFAHHYLGYLLRFLFLGVLRCFTSPGCRLFKRLMGCPMKVAPFRDPRVNGCLLLSAAFRSLLRLSSAFSAKAFPSCYVYLNLINPLWTSSKVFLPLQFFTFERFFLLYTEVCHGASIIFKQHNGGDDRNRTDDFLRAKQALSP